MCKAVFYLRRYRQGEPVAISGSGFAADAFREIAKKIIAQTVPVNEMAGCSARMLETVALALGEKPAKVILNT